MIKLGASLLEQFLATDTGHRGNTVDCGSGHRGVFVSYRSKNLDTVLGLVSVCRAWYHCSECGHGFAPLDIELGVEGASLSPGLQRMAARVGAAQPFAKGAGMLGELAGIELTAKRVERSAEASGKVVAGTIEAEAAGVLAGGVVPFGPAKPVEKLYVALDGTGVPTIPAETRGRVGKAADGRARTREVKLGCLFTQTGLDDKGRPVRDPASSSYVATFQAAEQFGSLVYAEARRRGSGQARQVIVLGDGAPWIWNLADLHFPGATQIVDLYHARQHLHALGGLVAPVLGEDASGWLAQGLIELDRGNISGVLAATGQLEVSDEQATEIDKALGYFETNRERMRYAEFRGLGLFVGSGAVEAGCRAVVAQRMKLSGMRWGVPGATGIITLRCQEASGRWEEIWEPMHTQMSVA